ncbi:EamA family transporter [Bacillus siamensis]|nr:EamA family transporter [Bacillus siamensis]MED0770485.1 EamA family transporter [Bacillus siamensis]MED0775024.1 EamA family transporter [Bacillus siamensis]MED0779958.1 EamA family transporter [Bacillus siamensis]MED0834544.1 EamA family transporter [Bacillus siamensis]
MYSQPVLVTNGRPNGYPILCTSYVTSIVGASEASISLYATPALSLLISWFWIGEAPAFISLLGGTVTVVGVCFIYLEANKIRLN